MVFWLQEKNSGDQSVKGGAIKAKSINSGYLDFALPIKEASKGFAFASSFLVLAVSAPPGLAAFTEFFMRCAVANPRFL